MRKLITAIFFLSLIQLSLSTPALADDASTVKVEIKTTHGNITLALDSAKAPNTVTNFLQYVDSGFYKGTIFHRVIKNFMIQGGGFTDTFQRKATQAPIKNEADNQLANTPYTIAMARTNAPHSATSQFFINTNNNAYLNHRAKNYQGWGYCVFGRVIEGQETVDKINNLKTSSGGSFPKDVPVDTVTILDISRVQ